MPRKFQLNLWPPTNPQAITRLALLVLALANLGAAYFLFFPVGGSPQDLRNQARESMVQLRQRQAWFGRTRVLAGKVELGRGEGDLFLDKYFLPRRAAYSTIVFELNEAAVKAKIRPKESAYSTEPIEGSDSLTMMQISANFEGSYPDLIQFVNLIDKSQRLLIIEGLTATPQQGSGLLNVNLKLDAFVREDGSPL